MIAEIYYQGKYIALINQDNGKDNLLIEFPNSDVNESNISRQIPLDVFLELVEEARKGLLDNE